MIVKDIINKGNDDLIIALSYLMDRPKSYFYVNPELEITYEIAREIIRIEGEISAGRPLQYAIGHWDFYGLDLIVDERALIPRFETEIIVEYIIKSDFSKKSILDIGIGSGAISLALGANLSTSQILGVDIEEAALSLAIENKKKIGLSNVNFIQSDLFTNVTGTYDIIVSNPPYISEADYQKLDEILYHEPKSALLAADKGLYFYKKIISQATNYLNKDGHLIFEIGYDQKTPINDLLIRSDFKNIINLKDYNDFDRFVIGQKG